MKYFQLLLLLVFFVGCNQVCNHDENWQIVFKHNEKGESIMGDKSVLLDAARKGLPIRIGFGGRSSRDTSRSVEHVADAQFLSILNGEEVFAQITEIFGQKPHLDRDTLRIDLRSENKWTLIIGTNGERSTLSRYFDPDQAEGSKQDQRGATWYVKLPSDFNAEKSTPIWH